jgi:hypothetical protein
MVNLNIMLKFLEFFPFGLPYRINVRGVKEHRKKSFLIFSSPAGMSLTWAGIMTSYINLFPPRESLISDIPSGDGNIENLFLR